MDTVQMRHPNLPQTITVPKSAVPHHQASGWEPVDDTPAGPAAEPAPRAAPAAEPLPVEASPDPKPARRRRELKEGE
ncbi:hypothetical protein WB388_08595 [Streptomyces brasiliscabiei]|uniref:Uncharacterized protein n=1 Tax=Streptomyces brasiliscabiei TaxID=2736302 RepID=A0ABU8GC19_9ACTN